MSDNLLTPQSGIGAGILHRNSVSFAERGPWAFAGVTWGDAVDGPADGEPTQPHHKPRGGTCAVCGASIINIVDVKAPKTGETATLGVDCAETMFRNQRMLKSAARLDAATKARAKVQRAAAKARKEARDAAKRAAAAEVAPVRFAAELALLDRLAQLPPSFARGFGLDMARGLRSGRIASLSVKQADLLARLAAEHLS